MKRFVIVGGVAAGATAAARLRRLNEEAEIVLIDRGPYVSYANCGLPYYIGGEIAPRDALFVATKESIEAKYGVDVRQHTEVTAIDREAKTVELRDVPSGETSTLHYDKLLLATGSSPLRPPLPGVDGERVYSLWTVPDADRIKAIVDEQKPQHAVVIGAGFIGLEMAENLVMRGLTVELVEMLPQVMPSLDEDMSKLLERELVERGVKLRLGVGVEAILDDGRGVRLANGDTIATDMVLLCIGCRPNNELAKDSGLELNARGYVTTNDSMQTSDPDIYAAGDVVEVTDVVMGYKTAIPLAGPANHQGRIAADAMSGCEVSPYGGSQGTSVARIFELTAASTGQSEKSLARQGLKYGEDYLFALVHPYSHATYFPGAQQLTLKLIFAREDGRVLGAQAVGREGVDKRIDVIATAIRFGATIEDLTHLELAYAPPYGSAKDPVNMAAYAASNLLAGLSEPCLVRELDSLDAGTRLLSVLEDDEQLLHHIPGDLHIPLTQLRERLDELDRDLDYVVYCAVGLRGYLAERVLKQAGYRVRNLLGGLTSYQIAHWRDASTNGDKGDDGAGDAGPADGEGERCGADRIVIPSAEPEPDTHALDVRGLNCPGPIVQVAKRLAELPEGDRLDVLASDPGFARDIDSWCANTGNRLVERGEREGANFAIIEKGRKGTAPRSRSSQREVKEKTMIVFSGELDKAIASFIIANGAAAMGNQVNMFFTFWGLNILRRAQKQRVKKDFMSRMFGAMMPRGSRKLGLSRMNFAGAGPRMIRHVMRKKNIDSLEALIAQAIESGVKITACQMSMDVMGITKEELIDEVEFAGVASMPHDNDQSNMNLFI